MKVHMDQGKYSMHNTGSFTEASTSTPCIISPSTLAPTDEQDYTALWNNLRESITHVKAEDAEHPPGQGAFQHLMSGYEASYYVYMYSMVFSADMWATVFEGNPLDPRLGRLLFFFSFPPPPSLLLSFYYVRVVF